jgi:hypothetical protein
MMMNFSQIMPNLFHCQYEIFHTEKDFYLKMKSKRKSNLMLMSGVNRTLQLKCRPIRHCCWMMMMVMMMRKCIRRICIIKHIRCWLIY